MIADKTDGFIQMIFLAQQAFSNAKVHATALREVVRANLHQLVLDRFLRGWFAGNVPA